MNTTYYLRNNPVVVIGVIEAALSENASTSIGRIAVLLPMILDEKIAALLEEGRVQYTFRQLVQTNNLFLSNYNERYLSLLPPLYHAISIMLDAGVITLCEENIQLSRASRLTLTDESNSRKIHEVKAVTHKIFNLSDREQERDLYQLLKVEI